MGIAHVAGRAGGAGDALLRDADIAMYAAKAAGKGQVRVFEPALQDAVVERVGLVGDLGAALGSDELFLRWQPLLDVATGRVRALEALPRWQHPQRGELPAGEFVAAEEQAGLALGLGAHLLGRACAALARWHALPGADRALRVVVGVSPTQVQSDGMVDVVREVLADTGIPPETLVLQLAGSGLTDVEPVTPVLLRLHALGVRLAVDDVGGAGSSLSLLRRLPLDAVALDPTLLDEVGEDGRTGDEPDALVVLEALVALAARLGLTAVATGVRTPAQWALLRRLGCPVGSAADDVPLPEEQVRSVLERLRRTG